MAGFLEYVPGDSPLHRMNPVAKVACALIISIACFCTSSVVFLAMLIVLDFALAASCRMIRETLSLARAVAVFSAVLALIALLTTPGGVFVVALPWGCIGGEAVRAAVLVIMRLVACAVPLFLVMYVTQLADLANAFCKILHVPYKYAFTFTSAVRFIPVFMNDMAGIMEAQTARGVEFDVGLARKLRLMVPLCVPLLVSSVRKTGSAAIAAQVRGFELRTPASGFKEYPFSALDGVAFAVSFTVLLMAIAVF